MELNKLNSQDLSTVQNAQIAFISGIKQSAQAELISINPEADTASSEEFNKLKALVAASVEPGRAGYIEVLKAAVANGEFNPSAKDIANSMFEDGTADLLV
jgi:anti-sigma28 factor (negative regulator of flagellin synthesis)